MVIGLIEGGSTMSEVTLRSSEPAYTFRPTPKVVSEDAQVQTREITVPIVEEKAQSLKQFKSDELKGESNNLGEEVIVKAIEKANKALTGATTTFEFSIHEQTKQIMVKVLDKDTGELIRELPPEKVLDMVAHLWEMAGIIVDEKG
jgi:flagellar protein FlaG